jgi:hypothetical protein
MECKLMRKKYVIRISKESFPIQIRRDQKQLENVEHFSC